MQNDGNLVLYDKYSSPIWATNTTTPLFNADNPMPLPSGYSETSGLGLTGQPMTSQLGTGTQGGILGGITGGTQMGGISGGPVGGGLGGTSLGGGSTMNHFSPGPQVGGSSGIMIEKTGVPTSVMGQTSNYSN